MSAAKGRVLAGIRRRRWTALFMDAVQELRDPWAIALAQVTAFVAFVVIGSPVWQVAGAAALVLIVRVIVGLLMPVRRPSIPPPSVLTPKERATVAYIVQGFTLVQIAEREDVTLEAIEKRERSARKKLGNPDHQDLVDWAVRHKIVSEPPPRHWYERSLVRGTLAGGGLIGLAWTIFQIWRTFFER